MSHSELKRFRETLSVVVCTYDRYDLLGNAIDSLLRQSLESFEIVVVDNSPDQEAAKVHARRYADGGRVAYILEPKPGLSRARNTGIAQSAGSVIAFIDDDAIANPNWAEEILKTFEEYPGHVGVAGGPAIPLWSSPRPEWLTDKLLNYLSVVEWGGETRELGPREWLAGCNMAFRRTMLDTVGCFSESLGRTGAAALLSNEETQIANLIRGVGGLIVYNPRASVHHTIDVGRLNELWFYRRAAWQAVSDFLSDTQNSREHAHKVIERISAYVEQTNPPPDAQARVAAVYNIVLSCLAGEALFGTENLSDRRESRFTRNLKSFPQKAIKRIKAALTF